MKCIEKLSRVDSTHDVSTHVNLSCVILSRDRFIMLCDIVVVYVYWILEGGVGVKSPLSNPVNFRNRS